MSDSKWISEVGGGYGNTIEVTEHLFSHKSKYQQIDIYETRKLGKLLMLDGIIQLTGYDEFVYHEMLANLPFYAFKNGVGIVDCNTFSSTTIPLNGRLLAIQECPENKVVCLLTKDGGRYNIYLIEGTGTLIGSFGFEASSSFITIKDGNLYIGRDTSISKIDLNRK